MGAREGGGTLLDLARTAASEVLDALPSGSSAMLVLASDRANRAIAQPTLNLGVVRRLVREAPLTDRATEHFPAIQEAVQVLRGSPAAQREIYVVTDSQAAGWRRMPEIRKLLDETRGEIRTHLLVVGSGRPDNLGVSGLCHAGGFLSADQPVHFAVEVANFGREEARDVEISLQVDADAVVKRARIPSIPAGGAQTVLLATRLGGAGPHLVAARIPADRLEADDQRSLAVQTIPEIPVLLVDGKPAARVRDSGVFFLKNALVPVHPSRAGQHFIKPTTVSPGELESARLKDFAAVFLVDAGRITQA